MLIACGFVLLGVVWSPLSNYPGGIFAAYLMLYTALNWGPNVSTFVLPQELFPAHIRSTFNGLAAASGKMGALLGAYVFPPIYSVLGMEGLMLLVAGIAVLGAITSQAALKHHRDKSNEHVAEYSPLSPPNQS